MDAKEETQQENTTVLLEEQETNEPATEVITFSLKAPKKQVQWTEDVVDNEGMGKKSSKKCCIFHKTRKFGESSTETDSSDEEREKKHHHCHGDHDHDHDHNPDRNLNDQDCHEEQDA